MQADEPEAPTLTDAERSALHVFWFVYDKYFDEVVADMQKDVARHPELGDVLALFDPDERLRTHEQIRRGIVETLRRPRGSWATPALARRAGL